ncbi:hypothetical protein [Lacihabitans sp. LS3-19]|uniref:hypothetical protein n=1 Tax=Lacihabitans sp. LS3-19 TaxID=2487335 RepID=UPI0020CF109D|nr:hypothetical protein [Lacihabitans sp. LS3-19]
MESITIKPRNDSEMQFVMEFIKRTKLRSSLDQSNKAIKKQEVLDGITSSVEQINQHMKGEIELKTLEEFLDEL